MAAFSSGLSKDRHHDIFKKIVGMVIMLPSESSGVIVNHEDVGNIRISCIIKKTVRKAVAQWWGKRDGQRWIPPQKEFELETPTLMLSTAYGFPQPSGPPLAVNDRIRRSHPVENIALVSLDESSEDRIMVKPYRIGNVYDGGNVCWGNNGIPKNLREAHNLFWSSGINVDFGNAPTHGINCKQIEHNNRDHNHPSLIHRHEHMTRCINDINCGLYNKNTINTHGPWDQEHKQYVTCENCHGYIKSLFLNHEVEVFDRCGGSICLCCVGRCSEKTGCKCQCNCCLKNCGCLCQCDLTDDWIGVMKRYQRILDKNQSEDWTRLVCGRKWNTEKPKFFSYNGHCDAIFISYDKDFIETVGEENVRKHHEWDAVIGLANITKNGWEIDVGNGKYKLGRRKVVPIGDMIETPVQQRAREEREYAEQQERRARKRVAERHRLRLAERKEEIKQAERVRALEAKITKGEVSTRESAVELWRRFYLNERNSSWWQVPKSLQSGETTVEVGRTWTN